MDFNSLKDQVSNLTLYDLKAGFRKAQNAVMNYTEMEAKVREATNNEPWGASSTALQEIANATRSFPTAYVRIISFDPVRQVQMSSLLVHRPDNATEHSTLEGRSK